MKARSLISCIILSMIVILLLPTATQANEYREVKAEKIVKQIENGEDVNYTDCYIVGELNTSKMKLETVPNQYFYRLLNKGYYEEDLIYRGLNENCSIIKSNVTIKNSIFENDVNFSNVKFTNYVDFSDANFSSNANFGGVNFSSYAEFGGVNFKSDANFGDANFNRYGDFRNVYFNGDANFGGVNFNSNAEFGVANFNSNAEFGVANFNSNADFSDANFYSDAEFGVANFNGDANFGGVNFKSDANFGDANFKSVAYFVYANFYSDADFSHVNFNSNADFRNANFNSDAKFRGPRKPDNIIITDGKSCGVFREYYESETRYEDADTIYYNYRKRCQDDKYLISFSKWSDIISWFTCGYGLKPLRIFWPGVFIIGFFALLYWRESGIYRSSDADTKKSNVSFWDGLYFSINIFTTLGSADWYPRENFRKWVTLEGLCGWIFLGIFMASLANILIRQ